jgi:LacI family sucrose operon transcriptional repressor
MASIKDVAKLAGVAASTVSLVLNNKGYVSEATRQKVRQAMEELSYVPSDVARNLSMNRTNTIGVVIPSISHPFFGELVQALEIELFSRNYKVMLCTTMAKKNAEIEFIEMLKRKNMDGIIMGAHTMDTSIYNNLDRPVLAFDRYLGENIPVVCSDHALGGLQAAQAFLKHNPKHVVQIIGAQNVATPAQTYHEVFQQELVKNGVTVDTYEMEWNAFTMEHFDNAAHQVFSLYKDIDGIFTTDIPASRCLGLAASYGYRVPEDLKIVAYDGTMITEMGDEPITTVRQQLEKIAELLAETIVAMVNGTELPDLAPVPTKLISRKTC